jgi:hypothetical protein
MNSRPKKNARPRSASCPNFSNDRRQRHHARQDRIDAEAHIEQVGNIGTENDESGMRDVDDVENAERDRNADGHRGIKSAEQDARNNRVDE